MSNESYWRETTNPGGMLDLLTGRASERKLRLFACACCRRLWPVLSEETGRPAVEAAEAYADGLIGDERLRRAGESGSRRSYSRVYWAARAVLEAAIPGASRVQSSAWFARMARPRTGEEGVQCALLRDIFGNPFRPAHADPRWLSWQDGAVVKMARAIYEARSVADLPILADALEEAGCTDADILSHCRGAGEHVLGCFVVDLLLEKA
jgi:hypothetical protein